MGTMCEIGWAWGNEGNATADTVCEFVDFLVEKQIAHYGEQLIARPRTHDKIKLLNPSESKDLISYIEHIGLKELWLSFEYNARYMNARWPKSRAEQLAKEVEKAASRAAYVEDPGLASIDIYSSIRFGPTERNTQRDMHILEDR